MTVDIDSAPAALGRRSRRRWLGLTALLIAEAMNLLDSTVTTVAAPVIRADIHGSVSSVQWIAAAYTLPFAIALIPGGRLGDVYGRRRIFLISLVGFLAASVLCAAAPAMAVLLPARVAQGLFAGLVIPQTLGLVKAMFTGPALGRALSFIGPVMGLTAIAGPVLGGLLTNADIIGLSWRAAFLVNLPLGVAVLAFARFLRDDRADRGPGRTAAAVIRVIEPSLFRDRRFVAALFTSVAYFAVSTGLVFAMVLYVQDGLGESVLDASLTVLPFPLGLAIASVVAGQILLPRTGPRLLLVGVGLLALGCAGGAAASLAGAMTVWIPAALGLAGIGGGFVTVPFFTAALSRVQPHEVGSAAGLLNSVQQLGGTVGVAGLGALYLNQTGTPGHALGIVFLACLAIALVLAATGVGMLRTSRRAFT